MSPLFGDKSEADFLVENATRLTKDIASLMVDVAFLLETL
jgi:hypothetical protein